MHPSAKFAVPFLAALPRSIRAFFWHLVPSSTLSVQLTFSDSALIASACRVDHKELRFAKLENSIQQPLLTTLDAAAFVAFQQAGLVH
jgi:hypothetical protein